MIKKEEIIRNLREYTSDEIIDAINAGEVTLQELIDSGKLGKRMREKLECKLGVENVTNSNAEFLSTSENDNAEDICKDVAVETEIKYDEEPERDMDDSYKPDKGMFNNPMSFHGRIRRMEYALSLFVFWTCMVIRNVVIGRLADLEALGFFKAWIGRVVYLALIWFSIAQACKRCHDLGRSGWWQLIPFYGFVLFFCPGDKGSNEYGDNPKE